VTSCSVNKLAIAVPVPCRRAAPNPAREDGGNSALACALQANGLMASHWRDGRRGFGVVLIPRLMDIE